MRLCLVSKDLASPDAGGIGGAVARAGRVLAGAGHETHVLTLPSARLAEVTAWLPGVHVHTARCDEGPGPRGAVRNEPMRWALAVHHTLARLQSLHPFDLVEFSDVWGGGAFALRAKRTLGAFRSTVLAVRLHQPSVEQREDNRLVALDLDQAYTEHQEALALREADVVVSSTRSLLLRREQRLGLRPPHQVIPLPLVPEPSSRPAGTPGPARILFLGPLEHRAGPQVLLDAALRVLETRGDVEFQFPGADTFTGPSGQSMRGWLERRVPPAWRERFRFEPESTPAARRSAIQEARVCCLPSLQDYPPGEGLEAMAAGAVVVSADAGGLAEFIEEGRSGLLFPSGNAARLAEVLERALTDEALRHTVSQEAPRRIAARCDPALFVARTLELLEHRVPVSAAPPPPPVVLPAPESPPAVSILVPYFNMGRFLPETLRSIQAQTFEDYEILLVEDGSTDPLSQRLVSELEGTPRLRVLRQPNGGLSSARNTGLRHARGRWVLPLDPDDLLSPTFLEKAVAVMRQEPGLGYVTSLVSYFTEDPSRPIGGWIPWGLEPDALCLENVASTCTALMERERVLEVGGYDEWLTSFEDWDVFCGLAERGYEGLVLPEFLFHYRQRPDSMTRAVATRSRGELISYLLQKHPELPTDSHRALRIQHGELQRLRERLAQAQDKPLRYRLVDQVNDAFKQRLGFVHQALRGTARLGDSSRRISERLQRLTQQLGRGRR